MTTRSTTPAESILLNGRLLTPPFDTANPPSALVVADGKIVHVGDDASALEWRTGATEVVDLRGQTVLPGLIDTHMHPPMYGTNLLELDCRPAKTGSVAAIESVIADEVDAASAGEWVRGWGWDESRMAGGDAPTRPSLDRVSPDHPVFLRRTCAHMAVVNSKALELAGITDDTPDPAGGHLVRDGSGRLTGLLQESAMALVEPPEYTAADIAAGLRLAQRDYLKWGVTTVHDMSVQGAHLSAYQALQVSNELTLRVRPWFWAVTGNGWTGVLDEAIAAGLSSGFGNDMIRIQGMKFMLDGSVGGRTAAVAEPFEGSAERGILIYDADAAAEPVARALAAGFRVAIHGIGDRAVDTAIAVFDRVQGEFDPVQGKFDGGPGEGASPRNRIEHCALPSERNLRDMKRLGLIAGSSVGFLYSLGDSYLANLGPERMKRVYPHKSFKDHGIVAPGNSDSPVTDGNPWLGIYGAVTRTSVSGQVLDTVQNISVADALNAYTRDAAYASFEETTLGTLAVGAHADMIVLESDPLGLDPEALKDVVVQQTYVAGRLVHEVG